MLVKIEWFLKSRSKKGYVLLVVITLIGSCLKRAPGINTREEKIVVREERRLQIEGFNNVGQERTSVNLGEVLFSN